MGPQAGRSFWSAYATHRAREGRGEGGERELLALPYLRSGALARHWSVRARSYEYLVRRLEQRERSGGGSFRLLDLGAGNGWLCYRLSNRGYEPWALDVRTDSVDGLASAAGYRRHLGTMFSRVAASFDAIPLRAHAFDAAVFNASLHYATDLQRALADVKRVVRPKGSIFIVDSPFYQSEEDGQRMVREKRRNAAAAFGDLAGDLAQPPFIEFLTPEGLTRASHGLGLAWRRYRVRYPLWYELRPWLARLRGRRPPSRFDLWEAVVP